MRSLILSLSLFGSLANSLFAWQNCPDFEEFDYKLAKAIEVLEAEESKNADNATLLEAIADLRKLQENPLSKPILDKSWASLYRIGGNSWKGVRSEIVELAKMLGTIHNVECIVNYNTSKARELESDLPPKSDDSPAKIKEEISSGVQNDSLKSEPSGEFMSKAANDDQVILLKIKEVKNGLYWLLIMGFVFLSIIVYQLSRIAHLLKNNT